MRQKDIIFIISSILLVVVIWIVFEIIHNSTTSTVSEKLTSQVAPIKADFDSKTIENIKNRDKIDPLFTSTVSTTSATPALSPTPAIQEIETETEGEEEATPEGELSL